MLIFDFMSQSYWAQDDVNNLYVSNENRFVSTVQNYQTSCNKVIQKASPVELTSELSHTVWCEYASHTTTQGYPFVLPKSITAINSVEGDSKDEL